MEWDEASRFPSEIIPKLAEMGLLGVIFPEQYGGAGLGYIEYATAIEELSRVDGSVGLIVAAHNSLCSNHIFKFGTETHKQKYLSPLAQGKKENKLGMRASDTAEVIFSDCRVPQENLLGHEGEGFIGSLKILDGGRISIAALALGMAQGALDAAVKYAKQRKQFGQAISEFQAIQFKLADMATEVQPARLLVYQAAWLADKKDVRFTRESSMAKLFASEVAVRVANECVQIHGGYGFIKDYPAEKFYRDVKLCTIGEGTSEIQKLVIARQLLGKK